MARTGLCLALWLVVASAVNAQYKVCVTHVAKELCDRMVSDLSAFGGSTPGLQCVFGRDRIDCMKKVANNEADFVNLGANEAYVASLNFSLDPIGQEQRDGRNDGIMYESVVVVKRSASVSSLSELKSKKSCHTGYGRTAGWSIPMSILRAQNDFGSDCSELSDVSNFFSQSCVPGLWASDPELDKTLKSAHSNLCQLCKSKCQTSNDDAYLGYTGALTCLTETEADVAFTKYSAAFEFFRNRADRSQYGYLCSNGTTVSLDSNCFWAARPTNYYMTRRSSTAEERSRLLGFINAVFKRYPLNARPTWLYYNLISNSTAVSGITSVQDKMAAELDKYTYRVTIDKPLSKNCMEKYVHFCVTSKSEHEKCLDLKAAAFAQRLRPLVACHLETDTTNCFEAISEGTADFITVDSGELFQAAKDYGLVPILSEVYKNGNTSYYAVAVVKIDSKIGSLQDLKGQKSCHTGYRRTAGWNVPVGVLQQENLVEGKGCDIQNGVAKFFNQSCVPGVSGAASLCALCEGDERGEHVCLAGAAERYYGYSGAFRCLADGKGDVAFVKHTTVMENTDGQNNAPWAQNLRSSDYSLLCREGMRRPSDDYETCNWATIPSHQVIASPKRSEADMVDLKLLLLRASSAFGPNKDLFKMFGKYNDEKDLLFKDSAVGLVALPAGATVRDVLKNTLYDELDSTFCSERSSAHQVSSSSMMSLILATLVYICFGF